ncbi:MAG: Cys-tRNA(Pro)/Cys-tRNA(Cys) deacylase YbaK [Acidimicrobiales bacterium AG-410-I20]|nr:MAG: Cys-tRNA(Pro)/Cys-tRNA(Cys) deacylase YbaK [Acidimicrobiales bacterium AG-410-I20]
MYNQELPEPVQRVVETGAALGVIVEPRTFPESTRTAQEAADAIGVDVGQIVKSLIFQVDEELVLAYVSGKNKLDESGLASAAGGEICQRVDAQTVRKTTGFSIGGVPPFGLREELRVFIDETLLSFSEVWAAAGTPNAVFAIDPKNLVVASGGEVSQIAAI